MAGRLEALVARPTMTRWAVLLGVLLVLPSLGIGLVVDDHAHKRFVEHQLAGLPMAEAVGWWDMFDVAGRNGPWDVPLRIYVGGLPWWSSPELSMAFLRPLGVATHYLDYGLWPEQPWLMHLHNLLWYGGLLALVGVLYRRIMGVGVAAGLAVLMYALDEAHAEGASWVAGRNTLMTAFFVVLTLVLYDRARRGPATRWAWLWVALSHGCALLSSEGGTAVFAYLAPYVLFIDRAPWWQRVRPLIPIVALTVVWQLSYRALGYGIHGSGLYRDPGDDPIYFLIALPARLPLVLRDQFIAPSLAYDLLPRAAHPWLDGYAIAVGAMLLVGVAMLTRRRPTAAFWAVGALLSAIPICAIGSTPRLLFVTAVGGFGLLGELIAWALQLWRQPTPAGGVGRRLVPLVALLSLLVHVPLAGALSPKAAVRMLDYDALIKNASASFPWGDDLGGKTVFVLNTPNYFVTTFAWAYVRGTAPLVAHILGTSMNAVEVTRSGESTLDLVPDGGYMLEPWSTLVRRPDEPFTVGTRVAIAGMWVEVVEITTDGRPARVRCHLPEMDSDDFVWVYWDSEASRYLRTPVPALGETLRIAREPDPSMRLDARDGPPRHEAAREPGAAR